MSAQKAPLGSWTQEILERKRKISALFEGSLICPPNKSMIFFTKSITNNLSFWSDLRLSKQLWALFSCFTLFPGLMSEKEQNNSVNGLCLDFFSPKGPRKKHSKPKAVQQKNISEIKQTMTLSIDQKCHVQKTHWWLLEQGRKVYKLSAVWCWSLCVCLQ